MTPLERLTTSLAALGIGLPEGADARLLQYLALVLEANKTMNLTAIEEEGAAVSKHLVDSLSALRLQPLAAQAAPGPAAWADVGSGAGLPGLPLALACPGAKLTLLESTGKKAHFLNTACAELGLLKQVRVVAARAEAVCGGKGGVPRGTEPLPDLRGAFDAVFFRGVSRLASLVELAAPLLKVGGLAVAFKGPKADEEIAEARKALAQLKMEVLERQAFTLPFVEEARVLVLLKKTGETPRTYPRLVGLAQKEPLL